MFAATLIVFREIFEMSLIICVVLAATKGLSDRGRWISLGILAGALASASIAFFANAFLQLMSGAHKDLVNAIILLTAATLIGWTVVWMKKHSKELVTHLKNVGKEVLQGSLPMYMLATVVGLAVFREGSEIVLFLYGLVATNDIALIQIVLGSLLGLALGVAFGCLMYYGLLRIPVKHLFSTTSWMLALLAAGMAANAAGKLSKVGLLPAMINQVWDTSGIISQHSLFGKCLAVLVGYQAQPQGIQLVFYVATIGVILFIPKLIQTMNPQRV